MDQLTTDAVAKLNAIHPVLGYIASAIFIVGVIGTAINNYRTKKNTDAHDAMLALINDPEKGLKKKIDDAMSEARTLLADFTKEVHGVRSEIKAEKDDYAIRVMHLKQDADSVKVGLSMIPRLQDRLTKAEEELLEERTKASLRDEKWDQAIAFFNSYRRK
jgi:vacuolar-type H+-ATPase subunit H